MWPHAQDASKVKFSREAIDELIQWIIKLKINMEEQSAKA